MKIQLILVINILSLLVKSEDQAISYYVFRGPVSGPVQKVVVSGLNPQHKKYQIDHVAKPDYFYYYGVKDPQEGELHTQEESRDGDKVIGEYKVLQPDGLLRSVTYTSDKENGFRANVEYIKV